MSRRERQRRRRKSRGFPLGRVIGVTRSCSSCARSRSARLAAAGWVLNVAHSAPNLSKKPTINPGSPSQVFAVRRQLAGLHLLARRQHQADATASCRKLVRQATIAIEDRRFYQHGALDYEGIIRAAIKDVAHGSTALQGASTLTQQLVDNAYLPKSLDKDRAARNLKYKIVQAKLAQQLESKHSKNWILTKYLNVVPYGTVGGETAYGDRAPRRRCSSTSRSRSCGSTRSALLAGLPQAPTEYNPFLAPAGRPRAPQPGAAGDGDRRRHHPGAGRPRSPRRPLDVRPDQQYPTPDQPVRVQVHRAAGRRTTSARTSPRQLPGAAPRAEDLHDAQSAPARPQAQAAIDDNALAAGRGRPDARRRPGSRRCRRPTATSSRWRPRSRWSQIAARLRLPGVAPDRARRSRCSR